jgi:hypothetical protein
MDDAPPIRLDDLITYVIDQRPTGGPLDHLSVAVQTAARLDDVSDHLIGHFVDQARRSGASWTEIGQSMGVTKQAVQKRFVTNAFGDRAENGDRYSRFTPRARTVVVLAEQHARAAQHLQVTPLHVLLGLLDEHEALAARALIAQGVTLDAVRTATLAGLGDTPQAEAVPDHIPFAPSAKLLLERVLREALLLGHNYIGTEHILLAMLSGDDGDACRVLVGLGVDGAAVEQWIVNELTRAHGARRA